MPVARAGLAVCLQRGQGLQRYTVQGSDQSPTREIQSNIRVQDVYYNKLCLLYKCFESGGEEEKNKGQTRSTRLVRILPGPCSRFGDRWVVGPGVGPGRGRGRAGVGAGPGSEPGRGRGRAWPRPPRPLYWASARYKRLHLQQREFLQYASTIKLL